MLALDMYTAVRTDDNVKASLAMELFIVDNSVGKCSFCPDQIAPFTKQNNPWQPVQAIFCLKKYHLEPVHTQAPMRGIVPR